MSGCSVKVTVVDREFLDWGGGEGEKIQVDAMVIGNRSGRNDLVQWTTRNDIWEPGKRGINPSQIG